MEKLDLTRKYKDYFSAKKHPELAEIGAADFLSITGTGDPSGESFAQCVEALYSVAYAVKFGCKERGRDFAVSRLEGLWSFDEARYGHIPMEEAPKRIPRSEWAFRLLIRMPEFVTAGMVQEAVEAVIRRKKDQELAASVGLFSMHEGLCVQMLHVGPFATEPESLLQMRDFSQAHHLIRNGPHHEIYLSDFRKTPQERLKTILREPVRYPDI